MVPMPETSPSPGVFVKRSSKVRRRRCCAIRKRANSTKLPSSTKSSMFSRAVRWARLCRSSTLEAKLGSFSRLPSSVVSLLRFSTSEMSGRMRSKSPAASLLMSDGPPLVGSALGSAAWSKTKQSPSSHTSPARARTSTTVLRKLAATPCSIFMDRSTTTSCPFSTMSPARNLDLTTWACSGARNHSCPSGRASFTVVRSARASASTRGAVWPQKDWSNN
mmetsp:Transcript_69302/g.225814  ORF Transcript_69302/g.225814 Transcript_69302/m.225814 type:complete len:220 (+) Transcript_69302:1397-2056(+)